MVQRTVSNAKALVAAAPAIRRAVGFAPTASSEDAGWENLSLCSWRGSVEVCDYAPFRELVIAFQTAGPPLRVRRDGRWIEGSSRPGLLTIVPPGTPILWEIHGEIQSTTVHLACERFAHLMDDDDEALLADLELDFARHDPLLAASITALVEELEHPTERGTLYAETLADGIALHLLRRSRNRENLERRSSALSRRALAATFARIEAAIATGVSLDELAHEAGVSRSHFTRAFRAAAGTSPRRYLTERRIARAKEMLAGTEDEIVGIAFACGFASQAHFTESFRRATGVTPLVFRRARG